VLGKKLNWWMEGLRKGIPLPARRSHLQNCGVKKVKAEKIQKDYERGKGHRGPRQKRNDK